MSGFLYFEYPKAARKRSKMILIIIIIISVVNYFLWLITIQKTTPGNLIQITGSLSSFHKKGESLFLNEYPNRVFEYADPYSRGFDTSFDKTVKKGDMIALLLNKTDFETAKSNVRIYGLSSQKISFLSPDSIKKNIHKTNIMLLAFLIVAGVTIAVYAILNVRGGLIDRFKKWYNDIQYSSTGYVERPKERDFNELES